MAAPQRNHLAEFFFVAAIVSFVWLFLSGGVYNAITTKRPADRDASQQCIVRILSVLDDGDETIYFPSEVRYTATLIGVPLVLAACGLLARRRKRP